MGISSEDQEPTGRAAPGTPKWTVKRNAPSGIRVRRAFTPTGMGWSVRRETAKDQDNSLKQMFRDYLDLDWELKPLVWLFSLNVAIWAFYGMSELVVAAAMTSRDKTDGLARQAEHDYWTGNSYVSWNALKEGKLWTLLTNGVIHDRFFILLSDMIFMSMVGPQLVRSMGSTRAFIALCATSSVVGSISTACAMHYLGEDDKIAAGGSTVINGMLTYFALVKGASKLKVAVIPFSLSAWMIPAFYIPYIAWVDYNSRKNMTGRSQPGGELVAGVGGAVGGGLFFVARKLLKL